MIEFGPYRNHQVAVQSDELRPSYLSDPGNGLCRIHDCPSCLRASKTSPVQYYQWEYAFYGIHASADQQFILGFIPFPALPESHCPFGHHLGFAC